MTIGLDLIVIRPMLIKFRSYNVGGVHEADIGNDESCFVIGDVSENWAHPVVVKVNTMLML